MNKPEYVFSPGLENAADFVNTTHSVIGRRELFYQLNQPTPLHALMPRAYAFINQEFNKTEAICFSSNEQYSQEKLLQLQANRIASLPEYLLNEKNVRECVHQTASILMTQPCWLQHMTQSSTSQNPIAVQLMAIYLQLTGKGQGGTDLLALHRTLMLSIGIKVPKLYCYDYSQQSAILSEMIDFAVVQQAMMRFPRLLFPEIVGFTLAYCQMPTLVEVCFPEQHHTPQIFFAQRQQRAEQQLPCLQHCINEYLSLFPHQQSLLWQRLQKGFWLYQRHMHRCRERLFSLLGQPLLAQQLAARLFQQKAAAAIGHHHKIQVQGKCLDQWFAGMPTNSQEFLQALKQSAYVSKQKPAESPLLNLFDFNGPMFGVLNASEREILLNWLNEDSTDTVIIEEKPVIAEPIYEDSQAVRKYAQSSNRELYYYLLNSDLFPEVLPTARAKAASLLKACAMFNRLPFKCYSHSQFDAFIENSYQREIKAYQPFQGKPRFSKQAYVWGLEQMAPMILIDGCWLQNSLSLHNTSAEITEILFSIYCDEVGNGHLQQNHPYIFQQLLDSLAIQLPPVYSAEFIKHSGFIRSAFDLPVFMLSLSCFPEQFLPELLGLNMAIELSGLGKGYMQLVDDWNYWGIDPTIAKIHISIDNAAGGHTFLAKKAIRIYMDEILQRTGDYLILDKYWRRIYNGYASLSFVGKRFKLALPLCYLIHKFRL